ncbi:MAG: MSHA biogenesis protein MshC [Shewanella sp.]|nr:MSHA biogenesis protein MshC [Shewanella sp.]
MILLGILAVTALPRFIGPSSFSAYSVRSEFISALRQLQQQAISNTDQCYRMDVTPAGYQSEASTDCVNNFVAVNPRLPWADNTRVLRVYSFNGVGTDNFVVNVSQNGTIQFGANQSCNGCSINVVAGDKVNIGISTEGYIYAR